MSDPTTDTVTTTAGAGDTPGTATGTGTQPGMTAADERKFSQEDVNRLLAEERRKADEKRKAEEARAKAAAAEEAARQAGEWQKLAETVGGERDRIKADHESLSGRYAALAAQVEAMVKAQLKELPEAIRDLDPGGDDLAARLAWVAKARKAAAVAEPGTRGTPPGPRGTGGQAAAQTSPQDLIEQKRRQIGAL